MTPAELKDIRKLMGMTQGAFANGIGLSLRGYEEIEAGRSDIRDIHINAVLGFILRNGMPEGVDYPKIFGDAVKAHRDRMRDQSRIAP